MLNGENINPTVALSVFIKQGNKYINLPFTKGGHHGNTWKRAALNINNMKGNFQFIFEVMLNRLQRSEVAIDDIIFDNNFCQKGLNDQKSDKLERNKIYFTATLKYIYRTFSLTMLIHIIGVNILKR